MIEINNTCKDCDYFIPFLNDNMGVCELLFEAFGAGDDWVNEDNEACDVFTERNHDLY